MGNSDKMVYENMTPAEMAIVFRKLADRFDPEKSGEEGHFSSPSGEFRKLKIGIKKNLAGYSVEMKFKGPKPAEDEDTGKSPATSLPGGMKYKSLKKRMQGSFKAIRTALEAGVLPPEPVMKAFLADAEQMILYPGEKYGESFYKIFDESCARLWQAFEAKDLTACRTAFEETDQLKKDCHERYK